MMTSTSGGCGGNCSCGGCTCGFMDGGKGGCGCGFVGGGKGGCGSC